LLHLVHSEPHTDEARVGSITTAKKEKEKKKKEKKRAAFKHTG